MANFICHVCGADTDISLPPSDRPLTIQFTEMSIDDIKLETTVYVCSSKCRKALTAAFDTTTPETES